VGKVSAEQATMDFGGHHPAEAGRNMSIYYHLLNLDNEE
jgi:hypothetical protein